MSVIGKILCYFSNRRAIAAVKGQVTEAREAISDLQKAMDRAGAPKHFGKRQTTPFLEAIGKEARANIWKTHRPDTLRHAISYALQTALANGDSYAIEWLRQWSEGEPSALAELRAAIGHGEVR